MAGTTRYIANAVIARSDGYSGARTGDSVATAGSRTNGIRRACPHRADATTNCASSGNRKANDAVMAAKSANPVAMNSSPSRSLRLTGNQAPQNRDACSKLELQEQRREGAAEITVAPVRM